jgi:branched-chain amino acid transport system ATP-binding protein
MTALRVDGVSVAFGGVRALSGVSLAVTAGEVCGVIGPNGAGKTTLFDAISGLCRSSAGRILLGGTDVTRLGAVRRARLGLRRTFQRQQLFGRLTVLENLLAATEWRGGGGGLAADLLGLPSRRRVERRRRERCRVVLEACGLADRADEYAGNLPVGLARLVEVARAVVDEPAVLLLDEPTSGLDAAESARLAGTIARLAATRATAILLVEHDVGFVASACSRLVVLDLGRVIADGSAAAVRADPRVRAAYLG